ncbi:hypothetical protein GCM10010232_38070 [Streptomyces amakusaensis]
MSDAGTGVLGLLHHVRNLLWHPGRARRRNEPPGAPFQASATFRTLARQHGAHGRIKDTACIHRTAAQRREAADTAVTLVVGLSRWQADFLYQ